MRSRGEPWIEALAACPREYVLAARDPERSLPWTRTPA